MYGSKLVVYELHDHMLTHRTSDVKCIGPFLRLKAQRNRVFPKVPHQFITATKSLLISIVIKNCMMTTYDIHIVV